MKLATLLQNDDIRVTAQEGLWDDMPLQEFMNISVPYPFRDCCALSGRAGAQGIDHAARRSRAKSQSRRPARGGKASAHRSKAAAGELVSSRKSSIFSSSWIGSRKPRRRPVDSEQGLGPDEPVSKSQCLQSAGVEQGARPRLATLSTSVLSGEESLDPQSPYVNEVSVNSFMLFMTTPSMPFPKPPPGLVMLV
jgi:hypothetical protein